MPKILLTPAVIKNDLICPEGKGRIELCDIAFPGLYVECRKTAAKKGTFYLRYKDQTGKTCHQKLGTTTDISLPEARRRAKDLKAEIRLGSDPRAEARKQKAVVTFAVFALESYLPSKLGKKRSYSDDEKLLRLRLLPTFGKQPLNKITRAQIQKFHSGLKIENLAGATCDHYLKLLHHMFQLAIDWEMLEKNPASRVPQFRDDNKRERYLSEDELGRLMSVLRSHSNRTIALLILWQLSTGARINESLRAKHEDINYKTQQWRIPVSSSKSKKARTVPLNATAMDVLQQLKKFDGVPHLFVNPRTKKRYVNVNKTWWDIRDKAELSDVQLHDCRHSFASMLVSQHGGRTLYEVQAILGHSSPLVTQRYAHLAPSTLSSAAEAASDCLGNALRDFDEK